MFLNEPSISNGISFSIFIFPCALILPSIKSLEIFSKEIFLFLYDDLIFALRSWTPSIFIEGAIKSIFIGEVGQYFLAISMSALSILKKSALFFIVILLLNLMIG